MKTEPLVELQNVSKRFGRTRALRDLSFQAYRGEVVGLLGPNGSGKSTLLKTIVGLVHPDHGVVQVVGSPPTARTRQAIAYAPEVNHLYRWMTVREVLAFFAWFYRAWNSERAMELIELMNLDANQTVGSLSKGLNARLRLVLAMVRHAPVVLLDEPLAGIDPGSRSRILDIIVGEFEPSLQTIILSTHEVAEAEPVFDRVVFLQGGRVIVDEPAESLRQQRHCSIDQLMREVFP